MTTSYNRTTVVQALRAANMRHKLRVDFASERKRTTSPGQWSPERIAYVLEAGVEAIRSLSLPPGVAWYVARGLARLATGRNPCSLPKLLRHLRFPCRVCGRPGTRRVGIRGYCRTHEAEARTDFAASQRAVESSREERAELFNVFEVGAKVRDRLHVLQMGRKPKA